MTGARKAAERIHNKFANEHVIKLSVNDLVAIIEEETRAGEMRDVLRRIINDLPKNRDWLDPALEQEARALLKETDSQ